MVVVAEVDTEEDLCHNLTQSTVTRVRGLTRGRHWQQRQLGCTLLTPLDSHSLWSTLGAPGISRPRRRTAQQLLRPAAPQPPQKPASASAERPQCSAAGCCGPAAGGETTAAAGPRRAGETFMGRKLCR